MPLVESIEIVNLCEFVVKEMANGRRRVRTGDAGRRQGDDAAGDEGAEDDVGQVGLAVGRHRRQHGQLRADRARIGEAAQRERRDRLRPPLRRVRRCLLCLLVSCGSRLFVLAERMIDATSRLASCGFGVTTPPPKKSRNAGGSRPPRGPRRPYGSSPEMPPRSGGS